MRLRHRLEKLEIQRAADDEIVIEKLRQYLERTVKAIAADLGVHPDELTIEAMAEYGDPLAQLVVQIRKRLEANSCVFDLV